MFSSLLAGQVNITIGMHQLVLKGVKVMTKVVEYLIW
jgi:hypothetical protein